MNLPRAPMGATSGWRPADPPRRPVLFVNPRSGDGAAERAGLAGRAREKGIETVILALGQDLAALAHEAVAAGADALGMAGGDGSLAVVAAAAAAHGIPFVCVPAGTLMDYERDQAGRGRALPDRTGHRLAARNRNTENPKEAPGESAPRPDGRHLRLAAR